jgi:hypothetical protein
MTDDEFAAKGRELIERFGKATEAYQRVGELAAQMLIGPMTGEQFAEMERLVEEVATNLLEVRAELAAYLTSRLSTN